MSEQFTISPLTAVTVVVTTVCIYLTFIVLVRLLGSRSLTVMSSFDFACVVAFGAVLGRTALLAEPTLAIGVVALTTFFGMQGLLGLVSQHRRLDRLVNRAPLLLVRDGGLLHANMRRAHVAEDEVRQAVRRAGLHTLRDVGYAVLERNGTVSVIRAGARVDPWLLADVGTAAGR
ncbi:DUF421 domain-containing protein [Nocardioides donggukensis]|uniref:DUF421 domain-containing protein n=1 Tax=Nocardioides donggukensis TaxID=2774019 RepID=A0A927K8D3_9ACTN|nr:YetF domain-containing protein [Nocardioides donggukensis]MBD8871070.1 DUF421 domain-containing protein [Nocardioides donggukensis]